MTTKAMTNHHSNQKKNKKKGHTITGVAIAVVGFSGWQRKSAGFL